METTSPLSCGEWKKLPVSQTFAPPPLQADPEDKMPMPQRSADRVNHIEPLPGVCETYVAMYRYGLSSAGIGSFSSIFWISFGACFRNSRFISGVNSR